MLLDACINFSKLYFGFKSMDPRPCHCLNMLFGTYCALSIYQPRYVHMYILWQTAFCLKYIGQPTGAHLALCFKSVEQLQCLCSRIHSISVCVNSWRAVCCFFIDRPISTCVNLRQTVCCFKSINPTLSACVICGNLHIDPPTTTITTSA